MAVGNTKDNVRFSGRFRVSSLADHIGHPLYEILNLLKNQQFNLSSITSKTICMKKILFCLLLSCLFQKSNGQFTGILHYENDYESGPYKGKVLTTIYESKSKARIESTNTQEKNGTADIPAPTDQNVILFDFDKQRKITLVTKMNMAVSTPLQPDPIEKMMESMGTTVSIEKIGQEKIGNYNCTHFMMNTINTKSKTANSGKKEFWVSTDLGVSNILYVSVYLYYPQGSYLQKKLSEAGVTGVVVKWQSGPATCSLVSYEKKTPADSGFEVPSNYTLTEH